MDFNSLTDSGADNSLPSLMYVDYSNQQASIQLPPPTTIATLPSISLQPPQLTLPRKRPNKVHVSAACSNCKKAHLACDVSRPCNRCMMTDKADTCKDIQHKKRGRPKMQRDMNNNKIRPATTTTSSSSPPPPPPPPPPSTTAAAVKSKNYNRYDIPTSNDMFTIFLSMDLCCARVSDKSLDYLELYPQEFSQRSMYDFLIPGESRDQLSKFHGYLLDNAVQYQPLKSKLPSDMLRSSSDKFFSTPLDQLLTISNGSLTLKHPLRFYHGRNKESLNETRLECKFFLGGGLGADILNYTDLNKLYIVCTIEQPQPQQQSDRIQLPPLLLKEDITNDFLKDPVILDDDIDDDDNHSHISSSSETSTNQGSQQQSSPHVSVSSSIGSATTTTAHDRINLQPPTTTPIVENPNLFLKYQTKPTSNQFIHPNELYYMKTTSSRLSSEAIAHTNFAYLSKTSPKNVSGSGPLAHYNSRLNK